MDINDVAIRLTVNAFAAAGKPDDFLAGIERDLKAIRDGTFQPTDLQQAAIDRLKKKLEASNGIPSE